MQQKLPDRNYCTGCSACYNICMHDAISMQKDSEGFLIPMINKDKCVNCNLCVKKCPVVNKPYFIKSQKIIYAAYNLNKEQHQKSASGGLFSAFANYFYNLDNGIVCASAFDSSLNLHFKVSKDKEDLKKFRGSKYVQSEIGTIYIQIRSFLISQKEVFFIGTPCQIAGLKAYLGKDYDNLFTVDLVCHGVPSPELFKTYLASIGIQQEQKFDNYYFRSQKDSAYFINSFKPFGLRPKNIPNNQHSYISAYLKGWIHRESCYNCQFTGEYRPGDCTISDFWGILSGKTTFGGKISNGVSMVMINTSKGKMMFEKIKDQLYYEEKSYEEALIDNHNLIRPDKRPLERNFIYNELITLKPEDFMNKYRCKLNIPVPIWKKIVYRLEKILKM